MLLQQNVRQCKTDISGRKPAGNKQKITAFAMDLNIINSGNRNKLDNSTLQLIDLSHLNATEKLWNGTNNTGQLDVDEDDMSLEEYMRYQRLLWDTHLYLTPVIIVIGLLGNITSFFVFVTTSLRHLSSSVYLAALALADSGFLFQVGEFVLKKQSVFCMLAKTYRLRRSQSTVDCKLWRQT